MGYDYNIAIGTFLKIKNKEIVSTKEVRVCKSCNIDTATPYCPQCGATTEIVHRPFTEYTNFYDIIDSTDVYDDFYLANYYAENEWELVLSTSNLPQQRFLEERESLRVDDFPKGPDASPYERLIEILKDNHIEYEIFYGIVGYYI